MVPDGNRVVVGRGQPSAVRWPNAGCRAGPVRDVDRMDAGASFHEPTLTVLPWPTLAIAAPAKPRPGGQGASAPLLGTRPPTTRRISTRIMVAPRWNARLIGSGSWAAGTPEKRLIRAFVPLLPKPMP